MQRESLFIAVNATDKLHLQHIYENPQGPPVFMLHGVSGNGRIFYSDNGKGLAFYLARQGFDVYIGDLRGKGLSTPPISSDSTYGQTESITEDIPAFIEKIVELRGKCRQHWISHSWGGVLLTAYYARFEKHRDLVGSMVYFAVKRHITVINLQRIFLTELFWNMVLPVVTQVYGYLPSKQLHISPDNETKKFRIQCAHWVKQKSWVDDDGFDYHLALSRVALPSILYLAGKNDHILSNPIDVFKFMLESGDVNGKFVLLSKKNGNLHDYDHTSMLIAKDAEIDHFPLVVDWLRSHSKTQI